jgi:hypothetical protein
MACAPLTGVPAAVLLTGFALALGAGQGLLAVFLFFAALIASQVPADVDFILALLATLGEGFIVAVGYRFDRQRLDRFLPQPPVPGAAGVADAMQKTAVARPAVAEAMREAAGPAW